MKDDLVTTLVMLRFVVGYLGERAQDGWWHSAFLSLSSRSFLTHAFVKTLPLAQFSGVTAAAAPVHDAGIGVGHVYHLFRLPEALEQATFQAMHEPSAANQASALIDGRETALTFLHKVAAALPISNDLTNVEGPTWVADTHAVYGNAAWARVAEMYQHGFQTGVKVYPFFADRSL